MLMNQFGKRKKKKKRVSGCRGRPPLSMCNESICSSALQSAHSTDFLVQAEFQFLPVRIWDCFEFGLSFVCSCGSQFLFFQISFVLLWFSPFILSKQVFMFRPFILVSSPFCVISYLDQISLDLILLQFSPQCFQLCLFLLVILS